MTAPLTDADILDRAADRLEKPGAWGQNADALDEDGNSVMPDSEFARCWCARGAVKREAWAAGNTAGPVLLALTWAVGGVTVWNDAPGRTQDEVVAALRETAKRLRGEQR